MSNILCTGSHGFVGKNVLKQLKGSDIREFNHGDTLLMEGIDTVIHLACDADSRNSNRHMASATENNIGIFTKVLEEAIRTKVKRFIYVSSIEAETEHNVYAICKSACEKILKVSGIPYVIIRPCNLYGPYMDLKNTNRNVVANFMRCIKKKTPMTIMGDKAYPFTYVRALTLAVKESLTQYTNQTITVGSSLMISIPQLAHLLVGITETWEWVKKEKI